MELTLDALKFHSVRSVPYVGTVVDGILNSGKVKAGDNIMIGPDSNGNYQATAIKSIQRKRSVSILAQDDHIQVRKKCR